MASFLFAAVVLWQSCFSSKIQYHDTYCHIILGASIFTVVPETQYVYINDTVTFECATNLTGYILFFETKLSVDETFDGMMVSLNLKGSIEVNGTAFTCRASNGDATEPAYVYVQGQYIHECVMAYSLIMHLSMQTPTIPLPGNSKGQQVDLKPEGWGI